MTSSVNWIYIVNHLDVSVNKQLYSNYRNYSNKRPGVYYKHCPL